MQQGEIEEIDVQFNCLINRSSPSDDNIPHLARSVIFKHTCIYTNTSIGSRIKLHQHFGHRLAICWMLLCYEVSGDIQLSRINELEETRFNLFSYSYIWSRGWLHCAVFSCLADIIGNHPDLFLLGGCFQLIINYGVILSFPSLLYSFPFCRSNRCVWPLSYLWIPIRTRYLIPACNQSFIKISK